MIQNVFHKISLLKIYKERDRIIEHAARLAKLGSGSMAEKLKEERKQK